jgi:hypothetical protein
MRPKDDPSVNLFGFSPRSLSTIEAQTAKGRERQDAVGEPFERRRLDTDATPGGLSFRRAGLIRRHRFVRSHCVAPGVNRRLGRESFHGRSIRKYGYFRRSFLLDHGLDRGAACRGACGL